MAGKQAYNLKDVSLLIGKLLPSSANGTVYSAGLDLGSGTNGSFVAGMELTLSAPALATTPLPDNATMTYDIVHSANESMSGNATLIKSAIVQTGASSAGAAAATLTLRLPSACHRYIGFKAVGVNNADASSGNATLQPKF